MVEPVKVRVKGFLKNENISFAEVGRWMNQSRQVVSNWFSKTGNLPIEVLEELVRRKNVNGHWLLTGEGSEFYEARQGKKSILQDPKEKYITCLNCIRKEAIIEELRATIKIKEMKIEELLKKVKQ